MRRRERQMDDTLAWELFREAPMCTLASTTPEGEVVLRTLNVVVHDAPDGPVLAFHGAPAGEKLACVGRAAVVGCEELVASIPSSFLGPERACPATTWYRSAQAHGVLEAVEDAAEKAAVLQAIMGRFQPSGGYRPITAEDPMYAAAVRGLLVVRLRPTRVSAKVSVGQDKPPEVRARLLKGLWERGDPGDVSALARSLSCAPDPWPDWLLGPDGIRLHPCASSGDHPALLALNHEAEWAKMFADDEILRAYREGSALVWASLDGRPVAMARAVADGGKFAYLADVIVTADLRGRGVGEAVVNLLLDHPAVRRTRRMLLRTRTAEGFWRRFGFETFATPEGRPWMCRAEGPSYLAGPAGPGGDGVASS